MRVLDHLTKIKVILSTTLQNIDKGSVSSYKLGQFKQKIMVHMVTHTITEIMTRGPEKKVKKIEKLNKHMK